MCTKPSAARPASPEQQNICTGRSATDTFNSGTPVKTNPNKTLAFLPPWIKSCSELNCRVGNLQHWATKHRTPQVTLLSGGILWLEKIWFSVQRTSNHDVTPFKCGHVLFNWCCRRSLATARSCAGSVSGATCSMGCRCDSSRWMPAVTGRDCWPDQSELSCWSLEEKGVRPNLGLLTKWSSQRAELQTRDCERFPGVTKKTEERLHY